MTNNTGRPRKQTTLDDKPVVKHTSSFPLPSSTVRPALVIGERDLTLLSDLLTHGAMLAEQIHTLYFAGRSRRRLNQRLQQLRDAGLIVRRPLPLGFSSALPHAIATGVPWIYGLGSAGVPVVAARLEWDLADVRRLVRLGTPTAIAHTLETVRLRLQAEDTIRQRNERETEGTIRLEFSPERLVRHAYQVRAPGGCWRAEIYKPDALLKIAFAGKSWQHYFAEVDLGHVSASEWGVKAAITLRYQTAGLFQKRYGAADFRTLVVTTGERRLAHLSQLLVRQLGAGDATRFGLTTFAGIAESGLLAPIWHVPGTNGPASLEAWP